jgi:hypothetical protein
MITPTGQPSWTRTATPDVYGAVPGLHDLGNVGAVNAKTDITAAQYTRMAADVTSAVRSAPLFWISMQAVLPVLGGDYVQVLQCSPQWDVPSGPYSGLTPPSGSYPTVEISGTTITLTFPDLVTTIGGVDYLRAADAFGVYGTCQIASADANVAGLDGAEPRATIVDGVSITLTTGASDGSIYFLVVR